MTPRFRPSTDRPDRLDVGERLDDVRRFTLRHRSLVAGCVAAGWTEEDLLQEVIARVHARQQPIAGKDGVVRVPRSAYDPSRGGVPSYLVPMTRSILLNLIELRSATNRPDHVEFDDVHHNRPDPGEFPMPATRRRPASVEPEDLDTTDPTDTEVEAPPVEVIRRARPVTPANPSTVEVRLEGFRLSVEVGRVTVDVPPELGAAGLELVAKLAGGAR